MQTTGIGDEALAAMEPSTNLLILAGESSSLVDQGLKLPLNDAKRGIDLIEKMNEDTIKSIDNIKRYGLNIRSNSNLWKHD